MSSNTNGCLLGKWVAGSSKLVDTYCLSVQGLHGKPPALGAGNLVGSIPTAPRAIRLGYLHVGIVCTS